MGSWQAAGDAERSAQSAKRGTPGSGTLRAMRFALCTGGKGSGQEAVGSWQRAESKGQGAECGALRAKSKALIVEYQVSEGYALCAMRYAISAMRLAPAALRYDEWPRCQEETPCLLLCRVRTETSPPTGPGAAARSREFESTSRHVGTRAPTGTPDALSSAQAEAVHHTRYKGHKLHNHWRRP